MTVAELIKELSKYNPKLEVVISAAGAGSLLDEERGAITFQTGHTQIITTIYGSRFTTREERLVKSARAEDESVLVIRQ